MDNDTHLYSVKWMSHQNTSRTWKTREQIWKGCKKTVICYSPDGLFSSLMNSPQQCLANILTVSQTQWCRANTASFLKDEKAASDQVTHLAKSKQAGPLRVSRVVSRSLHWTQWRKLTCVLGPDLFQWAKNLLYNGDVWPCHFRFC